ncbi:MAG: TIGR00730 family Rossman fold protein [Planctomycetaceae bacterium]|nr:TIGR00730 family Rossman fold protein [Planctomycetaceae bacterium]
MPAGRGSQRAARTQVSHGPLGRAGGGRRVKSVCVYCGSSIGARDEYTRAARELGRLLAQQGLRTVYGAGNIGLMGELADAVLDAGGEIIGVIPEALVARELAHSGVTDLRIVHSMHERKALMADLSDAFIALPGGFGTFEELCEMLTWVQLGIHSKPCGLLNVAGYFDPLIAMFDRAVDERFLRPQHRALLQVATDPTELLDRLRTVNLPQTHKWLDRDER